MTVTIEQNGKQTVYRADPRLLDNLIAVLTTDSHDIVEINNVYDAVVKLTGITRMPDKDRHEEIVYSRHLYCYVSATQTKATLKNIGAKINIDHTTTIHGRDRIKELLRTNPDVKKDIERLRDILEGKEVVKGSIFIKRIKKKRVDQRRQKWDRYRVRNAPAKEKIERPPAVYSNTSYYGII